MSELAEAIRALAALLRDHGEERWAAELLRDAELIGNDDFYGVERFLSHFGGMGSLNDVLSPSQQGNERLAALSNRAFELADEARRGFRSSRS